jgi:hypothetical protein
MQITITRQQLVGLGACQPGLDDWDDLSAATGADPEAWTLTWTRETQIASLACPQWRPWMGWLWQAGVLPAWSMRGTDLRRADMSGADLRGAVLRGAVLRWADLRGAVRLPHDLPIPGWSVVDGRLWRSS